MPNPTAIDPNQPTNGDPSPGAIRLRVKSLSQLFNSLDPSPFIEKDLDPEAEAFIVSWAREHPANTPLTLTILMAGPCESKEHVEALEQAVHNYFEYRMGMAQREFREVIREGQRSLAVGLVFLATCSFLATVLEGLVSGALGTVLREGFMIGGWVAMWRPLELLLYSWWPVRKRRELFRRLSTMKVRVEVTG